jgi:pimeloyl-ACP methyl ester carboxylesterase
VPGTIREEITPADRAGYRKPLKAENWDRALWELTKASREPDLGGRMGSITLPSLAISGNDDRVIAIELSVRLAEELPNAGLVVISDCGHVPHKQCPEPFLDAVEAFLGDLR